MIQCVLSPTLSLHFAYPSLMPFSPYSLSSLLAQACAHAHKVHSLEKPSQQFGLGV